MKPTNVEIVVLAVLATLSLVSGFIFKDIFTGFGSGYFSAFIYNLPAAHCFVESEFLPAEIKLIPVIFTASAFEFESRFFECKWFYNEIINGYLAVPSLIISRHIFEQHEKIMLEQNGPLLLSGLIQKAYRIL